MSDVLEPSAGSPPNHYVYETIDSSSIRLLTLAPSADPASRTEVLLQHCKRTENPGYAAISYTWGDERASHSIYCDCSVIKVTKGCEDALRALRHNELPRNLWIDAVCINQADLGERTQQVAIMGEVYRRAGETFAYLGESDRCYDIYDSGTTIENSDWIALLQRPWFRRTWVIQELMLSRRMTLVVGRQMLALSDLLSLCAVRGFEVPRLLTMRSGFLHDYARRPPKSWDHDGGSDGERGLDGHEVQRSQDEPVVASNRGKDGDDQPVETSDKGKQPARDVKRPIEETPRRTPKDDVPSKESGHVNLNYWMLHDMLRQTADFGCRDLRDKLFAILPLFKKPIPTLLYPDYKKTTQEVFADLSWFLIQQELPQCLEYTRGPNDEGMPSWATNWSKGLPWLSFEDEKAVSERVARWRKSWRAGFQAGAREIRSTRVDSRTISLRGLTVGEVVRTQRKRCFYFELDTGDGKRLTSVIWALRQKLDGRSDFQCKVWRERREGIAETTFLDRFEDRIFQLSGRHRDDDIQVQRRRVAETLDSMRLEWWVLSVCGRFERSESIFVILGSELERRSPGSIDGMVAKIDHRRDFFRAVTPFAAGRCAVRLETGGWGLAPGSAQPGDCLCILLGFKLPFVLRRHGSKWILVGECLMDEMVDGIHVIDAVDWSNVWSNPCPSPFEDFVLE